MELTACTLKHIKVVTVQDALEYYGPVDFNGVELPDYELTITEKPQQRVYRCSNCHRTFDGTETFDEVKAHLGTFNSWVSDSVKEQIHA